MVSSALDTSEFRVFWEFWVLKEVWVAILGVSGGFRVSKVCRWLHFLTHSLSELVSTSIF